MLHRPSAHFCPLKLAAMHVLQEIVQDGRQGPKAALKDLARQGAEGAEGLAEQAQQRLRERVAQDYGAPLDPVRSLCVLQSQGHTWQAATRHRPRFETRT